MDPSLNPSKDVRHARAHLKVVKDLHAEGLIDDEDFERRKKHALDRVMRAMLDQNLAMDDCPKKVTSTALSLSMPCLTVIVNEATPVEDEDDGGGYGSDGSLPELLSSDTEDPDDGIPMHLDSDDEDKAGMADESVMACP